MFYVSTPSLRTLETGCKHFLLHWSVLFYYSEMPEAG